MIGTSGNVRVYLACGVTDMRRGIDGLSALVETAIRRHRAAAQSSACAENAPTGSSFFGGTANGSACFTRFWSAGTLFGQRRKRA